METRSLKASTKEEELFGVKARKAVAVNIGRHDLDSRYYYCILPVKGDCMDSDRSPMRIKDGDCLLMHQIPLDDGMWAVNKVICFIMDDGKPYVKQLVFWDGISSKIVVKLFVPEEQVSSIPLRNIRSLFVVDKAFSPEYIKAHERPL